MKDKIKQYTFKATELSTEGQLEAVFSVFDVIDSDGDVVKSSAIPDGKEIPLVWSHDWSKPIGKGVIHNDGSKAVFKGSFNLNTSWGRDAYESVKDMGDLQEYSWGFKVLKEEKGEQDGRAVNNITLTEPYEASPVLVGANRETGTVGIKSYEHHHHIKDDKCIHDGCDFTSKMYVDAQVEGSYEELRNRLNVAFRDRQFADGSSYGYSSVVATFDNRFIAMMWQWDDEEDSYWEVSYSINGEEILLGDPKQVTPETSFVPVNGQGMSYEQHSDYVQAAVSELLRRSKYLVDAYKREATAKPISDARRERMKGIDTWLSASVKEITALVEQSIPEASTKEEAKRLHAQFLHSQAQLLGVN